LSCKACSSDCPAGVDLAQYKAEVLYRTYRGSLRPAGHHSVGWLPRWIALLDRIPRLGATIANPVLGCRPLATLLFRAGGLDPRRPVPAFAPVPFHARPAESIVLADGCSCRTQVEQLAGLKTMHLAEFLAERFDSVLS